MAAERSGREYLARHRVAELLHGLGALLLHHRPGAPGGLPSSCPAPALGSASQGLLSAAREGERPREFLIQALERIKLAKRTGVDYPYLMDESNLEAMFEMLDTASQGYITLVQYKEALKTLGLSAQDVSYEDGTNITLEIFKEEVKKKMLASWVVY